jgi:hypothetical protein
VLSGVSYWSGCLLKAFLGAMEQYSWQSIIAQWHPGLGRGWTMAALALSLLILGAIEE